MVSLNLIDTHVHLDDDRLRGELAAVVQRAIEAGVQRMICIATTAESARHGVEYAQQFESVFASVGIPELGCLVPTSREDVGAV